MAVALAMALFPAALAPSCESEPRLIFYYETGLLPWSNHSPAATLMREAAACGYTEMVVADGSLQNWQPIPLATAANLSLWQRSAEALDISLIPLIFPFSVPEFTIYPSSTLGGELAEPLFSAGVPMRVSTDGRRLLHTPTSLLHNGNFSSFGSGEFAGWRLQRPGARTFVDTRTTHSPGASLRIGAGFGPAMASQPLRAPSRRQLNVSFWAKSQNLSTVQYNVEVCAIDGTQPFSMGRRISWHSMVINATQDWTHFSFVASSWQGPIGLFVGLQPDNIDPHLQPMNGSLWFDDIVVEDTALHNLVRRAGAPLRIYDPHTGIAFREGIDYHRVAPSPKFSADASSTTNITLPSTTRLATGQRVLVDYYAVDLVFGGGTYACMMHHDSKNDRCECVLDYFRPCVFIDRKYIGIAVFRYMERTMQSVLGQYDKYKAMFIHYDEIRTMHGCELCSGPFDTAGALLAWHARNATQIIRNATGRGGAKFNGTVMTWDDMFNPHHNAGDDYFLVNGTLNGSWLGLDPSVTVVNWGAGDPSDGKSGLKFFSRRGHDQIFAGYYDSKDGAASARAEWEIAQDDSPGATGADSRRKCLDVHNLAQRLQPAVPIRRNYQEPLVYLCRLEN
eukprot:COSAG02_NODE_4501_length_5288_cov_7.650029_6_plen_620_part_00